MTEYNDGLFPDGDNGFIDLSGQPEVGTVENLEATLGGVATDQEGFVVYGDGTVPPQSSFNEVCG